MMTRKRFLAESAAFVPSAMAFSMLGQRVADTGRGSVSSTSVLDFGAKGDGVAKDTRAIQLAINAAGEAGGTVHFPPGKYLSGTLDLRSFVTLFLSPGSVLIASPDPNDFDGYEKLPYQTGSDVETTYFHDALLLGEDAHNVAIGGQGIIDGNRMKRGGPKLISLKKCTNVQIRDISLKNAPNYTISMLGCEDVEIGGISIFNGFADGIDPDCSRNVRIANCYIESWDDCICPKSSFALGERHSTENITVTNCVLTTASDALKLGTESSGDFKNIAFTNCTIFSRPGKWKDGPMSGVAIESVDGANIDGITISNIAMEGVRAPIFVRLGNRGRAQKIATPGTLQNVVISNVTATGGVMACSITGIPGYSVKHVSLSHVRVTMAGGGLAKAAEIGEEITKYPEADMFGELPAYALFCRHTEDLTLCDVHLATDSPDERPALVAEEVTDLDLMGIRGHPTSGDRAVVHLTNARRVFIHGTRALPGTGAFLRLGGDKTEKVHVLGNDLSEARLAFALDDNVDKSALTEHANVLPKT
jgi:polygalacturonase